MEFIYFVSKDCKNDFDETLMSIPALAGKVLPVEQTDKVNIGQVQASADTGYS